MFIQSEYTGTCVYGHLWRGNIWRRGRQGRNVSQTHAIDPRHRPKLVIEICIVIGKSAAELALQPACTWVADVETSGESVCSRDFGDAGTAARVSGGGGEGWSNTEGAYHCLRQSPVSAASRNGAAMAQWCLGLGSGEQCSGVSRGDGMSGDRSGGRSGGACGG